MEFLNKPQNGFKRPLTRPRHTTFTTPSTQPVKGVVYDIINLPKFCYAKPKPLIAQEKSEEYLRDLKKNYKYHGIPFKQPNIIELQPRHRVTAESETHIEYLDQVQVNLSVLKNGNVRVKMVLHGAQMYEKYYSHAKAPPLKTLTTAYKNLGYSEAFITAFIEKHKKRVVFGKKVEKILEAIFDKSVNAKKKTAAAKKKAPVEEPRVEEEEEEAEDEDEEDDEDGPEEDEALVADDEEEEVEEPVDEDVDFE
jgi:hypothetical protein